VRPGVLRLSTEAPLRLRGQGDGGGVEAEQGGVRPEGRGAVGGQVEGCSRTAAHRLAARLEEAARENGPTHAALCHCFKI
jgi:hypothetical protein